MPLKNNDLVVGAVGVLQYEVVAFRLKDEYKVDCIYEPVTIYSARWVDSDNKAKLEEFKRRPMKICPWMGEATLLIWLRLE